MLRGVTFQRIQSRYISRPTGLAVFEEELYWANQVHYDGHFPINKILNANKFLANDSHPREIVSKLHNVASELHIFHAALQIQSKKTGRLNSGLNRACKLFNIRLYATLCFNYFR